MASAAKKLLPVLDKVLLEKITAETSHGGILLPSKLMNVGCETARVVAVGKGKYSKSGKLIPPSVKPGDTVLLPDRSGTFVKLFGKEYVMYEDNELLGIIHDD